MEIKTFKKAGMATKLFEHYMRKMPIVCVDLLIKTPEGVMLGVRSTVPAKGLVWPIGGRIHFGEPFRNAVMRKAREEASLKVRIKKLVGLYSTRFTKGEVRHTINAVFLVRNIGGTPKPDKTLSGFVVMNKINGNLHPYVRRILRDSGVFGDRSGKNSGEVAEFVD